MKRAVQTLVFIFVILSGGVAPAFGDVLPSDPLFEKQSYLRQVRAQEAWQLTTGSSKVVIAVLDSGMDIDHPDLQNSVWFNLDEVPGDGIDNDANGYIDDINGWDFINDIPDPQPKFGGDFLIAGIHHGTLLAGIIGAQGNNGLGITGISWRSKIMPLRVLNNQGDGDVFTVVRAIDYAIAKKVDVINLSFAGDTDSSFLRAAITRATNAGIIVVTASGNDQSNEHGYDLSKKPVFPACYNTRDPLVISVAAVDSLGQKARFSNFGPCIDTMAPGTDILSTQVVNYERVGFDSFYGSGWSGSSLSTAMVSGAIALMKSINPALPSSQIANLIRTRCDSIESLNPFYPGKLGCGSLNIEKLVRAALDSSNEPNPFEENAPHRAPRIMVAPALGQSAPIVFDSKGALVQKREDFQPFTPHAVPYTVHTSPASGVTIYAAGPSGGPHVRLYDKTGALISQFFAYDPRFRGGVIARIGDIDGDGEEEVVTVPASNGGPHIKIFTLTGILKKHFFVYASSMRSGYALALGDVNDDGKSEIIVSSDSIRGGDIRVVGGDGALHAQFLAYPNTLLSKLAIAIGDLDGDGSEELVVAPEKGRGALKIFSGAGVFRKQVFPYGQGFGSGYSIVVGDLNTDQKNEIITAPHANAPAHVMIINGEGAVVGTFFASPKNDRRGYIIGIVNQ